jgi:Zn-dependent M32 family carboxypeptidase
VNQLLERVGEAVATEALLKVLKTVQNKLVSMAQQVGNKMEEKSEEELNDKAG